MRCVLAVIVVLSCASLGTAGDDWLDLDARVVDKNSQELMCQNKLLNLQHWPNKEVKTDYKYSKCYEECDEDVLCQAVTHFKGNKTCQFKEKPTGVSTAAMNGVFNQSGIEAASWVRDCKTQFSSVSFCAQEGFRLGGLIVGGVTLTNSIVVCRQACNTTEGCSAFTIQDGRCTLFTDGYIPLWCSGGNCYSATLDCYKTNNWTSTTECMEGACASSVNLTQHDLIIEYIATDAHLNLSPKGRKDIYMYKETGEEIGSLQLHTDSLWFTDCNKGQKDGNLATWDKQPFVKNNELRRFHISINATYIAINGAVGPTWLNIWNDVFETDSNTACGDTWNNTVISKIGFRYFDNYGAQWTLISRNGAGIRGVSALAMAVWAVLVITW